MGNTPTPSDQCAHQHRYANPESDQMADPEQGERKKEIESRDAALVPADAEVMHHVAREHARRNYDCEERRYDRTP